MSSARDAFFERVRQAVADGNRAGTTPELPNRGQTGYVGAGSDLPQRFCEMLTAVGGKANLVADSEAAAGRVMDLVQAKNSRRILLGRGPVLDQLQLPERLRSRGLEVAVVDALALATERDTFFQADIGISGVENAIAETGTLVMASRRHDPRSLSLLPAVHIAVLKQRQLVPDLFDLFANWEVDKDQLPSCLTLITGPSKTGDIELKLVTGVHGPGELHAVIISENA
jgi:L-lactate dehydrogenase complex protein LldG